MDHTAHHPADIDHAPAPRRADARRARAEGAAAAAPSPGRCSGRWRGRAGACCARRSTSCCCASAVVVALGGVHATLNVSAAAARRCWRCRRWCCCCSTCAACIARACARSCSTASCPSSAQCRSRRWPWRCSACSPTDRPRPSQTWLRAWLFALIGVGLGASPCPSPSAGRVARRLVGKPVLIMGAGRGRRAGRAPAGEPSRVRAGPGRLPRRGPALGRGGGRTRRAGAGHGRGPRGDRRRAPGVRQPDRRVLLGRRRARQPPDPALPGAGRRGVGRAAHVRHDQRPRRL